MKLLKIIPKKFLKHKKTRSVSRSDDPFSFSSGTTSSEDQSSDSSTSNQKSKVGLKSNGLATPTSVLPSGGNDWPAISADVYCELVQAFKMIDGDGDAKITMEELKVLLTRIWCSDPPSEDELVMMLNELDQDGDGCISLEEFGAIGSAFGPPTCDSELRGAFEFFDADHDGKITAEELHNVFSVIGDGQCTLEDCRRMISGVDKNGDGFVCFEDFSRMMEMQRDL